MRVIFQCCLLFLFLAGCAYQADEIAGVREHGDRLAVQATVESSPFQSAEVQIAADDPELDPELIALFEESASITGQITPTFTPAKVRAGEFINFIPGELQFGCVIHFNSREDRCAEGLQSDDPQQRLEAAQALWRGQSRRHAEHVLAFLAGPVPHGRGFDEFKRLVEESLRPAAILREMEQGNYVWGLWLAYLKPDKELVPALLKSLKERSPYLDETIIVLGKTKDPRALAPLLQLLKDGDYKTTGFAADALAYLGDPAAEPALIDALQADNSWVQASAASALARIGTGKAIPALERLASNKRYTGAIDVDGSAQRAIDAIKVRSKTGK